MGLTLTTSPACQRVALPLMAAPIFPAAAWQKRSHDLLMLKPIPPSSTGNTVLLLCSVDFVGKTCRGSSCLYHPVPSCTILYQWISERAPGSPTHHSNRAEAEPGIRRAGYAVRRPFKEFFARFRILAPNLVPGPDPDYRRTEGNQGGMGLV